MPRRMIILRGLSGSGKSTVARALASTGAIVCSADDYFMRGDDYRFNPRDLPKAHADCVARVHRALIKGLSVIVDNTHTRHWEYSGYVRMAREAGYTVDIVVVGGRSPSDVLEYANRNTHGVPFYVIQCQADRWED